MARNAAPSLEFNAAWLREQRSLLGWSTSETAEKARQKAREFGDTIKLPQQLVSKFENGGFKSVPRWLGYAQMAMAEEVRAKGLPEGNLWKLRLPQDLQMFFAARMADHNADMFASASGDDGDGSLTDEERIWLDLMHALPVKDRAAIMQLALTIVSSSAVI